MQNEQRQQHDISAFFAFYQLVKGFVEDKKITYEEPNNQHERTEELLNPEYDAELPSGDGHQLPFRFICNNIKNKGGKKNYMHNVSFMPADRVEKVNLIQKPVFMCIKGLFLMATKSTDEKNTNIYAFDATGNRQITNNIQHYIWKIKNVPIENAKKFLSSFDDILLSPFGDNPTPSNANNFAIQVKNELDFKCVFSEIVNNDNKNKIAEIVNKNHQQLDVINKMRKEYKKKLPNNGNQMSFKGFDNEDVKLYYNTNTGSVSNDWQKLQLEQNAYYFGKHGLLMAITKSHNGKVNVFATQANSVGGNEEYAGLFAVYDASQEDAERFIQKLNQYNINEVNYTNIDSQEKFEQFFQCHCKKNETKIEDKEVDTGFCLFNLCGCGNQQNVVN